MSHTHQLPELPYAADALEPHISRETLEYHHGKHHASYVKKLNGLIEGTEYADQSLEDIVRRASGGIFNNAAQVWNHNFYWRCLSPEGGGRPNEPIAEAIQRDFQSFDGFQSAFSEAAAGLFGSGWTWLALDGTDKLQIVSTSNADNPLRQGLTPLLTCDVWEHAYYIDYRNRRPDYIQAFWSLVNWPFVNDQFQAAGPQESDRAVNQ